MCVHTERKQTERIKFVETETTVGTRLESADARARAKTLSDATVAPARPAAAAARTISARASRPSNAILPQSAAAAPRAPAIAASQEERAFILVTSKKKVKKSAVFCVCDGLTLQVVVLFPFFFFLSPFFPALLLLTLHTQKNVEQQRLFVSHPSSFPSLS